MPTPHITAAAGDFAETVLLPGDPLRAKVIAETFFDDAVEVTSIRNMLGFTGTYKGHRISAMGTGMGIPSASIYITELIDEYGVRNLIRVGTCGAIQRDVKMRDVILAIGACTDSGVNRSRFDGMDFAATASYPLLSAAARAASGIGVEPRVGNIFSGDLFYQASATISQTLERMGVLAVEMEAAGLYGVAAEKGVEALAICTVSDHLLTGEAAGPEERQTAYTAMMQIALETAISI